MDNQQISIGTASRPKAEQWDAYPSHFDVQLRWSDNDAYGHVNNVVYYSWFDTVVNQYLVTHGVLDIKNGATIGLVVETGCNFFESVSFPGTVSVGLRVAHLGKSSVRYELGVFKNSGVMAAKGHFVHVYVDSLTRRPAPLPEALAQLLEQL
jgi:acyl-CoA thioester hydrolase